MISDHSIRTIFLAVFLATATFTVATIGYMAYRISAATVASEDSIAKDFHALVLPTENADAQIASASRTFAQVGAKERDSFASQQAYYSKLTTDTDAILGDVHANIIPRMVDVLSNANVAVGRASDNISRIGNSTGAALDKVATLTEALKVRVQDPKYDAILADTQDSMHNLAGALASAGETTANLADTTKDIKDYVHRETAPVTGTWHAIKAFLFELAGPLAEVATAAK